MKKYLSLDAEMLTSSGPPLLKAKDFSTAVLLALRAEAFFLHSSL